MHLYASDESDHPAHAHGEEGMMLFISALKHINHLSEHSWLRSLALVVSAHPHSHVLLDHLSEPRDLGYELGPDLLA